MAASSFAPELATGDITVRDNQSSIIESLQVLRPAESVFRKVKSIIAEEMNVDFSNVAENVRFEELGIDSILRMPIVSKIQEEMNIYLSLSAFDDYPTLAALRGHIQDMIGINTSNGSRNISSSMSPILTSTPSSKNDNLPTDSRTPPSDISMARKHFSSRPILLSGRPIDCTQILFLMSDGAGSPSSYALLPALPRGTAVYGLESPFCHNPLDWNCSFKEVATMYVNAMRKIQPDGPYMLGGWSLGGIHAYEVAQQLLQSGEKIQGLLLIDTPNPNFLGHISNPVVELLEETGIMAAAERINNGKILELERVKDHMRKCVESLQDYIPGPIYSRCRPDHVFAIWAAHGLEQCDDDAEVIVEAKDEVRQLQQWMKQRNTSFGPNGWDRLLDEIDCRVAEGDHLSILRPPWVEKTGQLVAEAVDWFMSRATA
ncbi:putative secondary metabolism biosynthetic enzyme [Aspergillus chevalieri]|uniref:Putative secondary metabolism biosynthetic enzyme n=1 Tax=Aspergillus chevalieri TaxID=182096 RepID=A0A7R7VRM4_ASPCH|nr:putative secondary metabolism biosynthetic enzyme [Aspergillus chevalieri]BCR88824.1 putative secondary metabolism biosynthetic enzyme [Aspergillus chevalieri]